jgi:hypothetical protein
LREHKTRKEKNMAKSFIDFILDCEKKGGGVLLREYLATSSYDEMKKFFVGKGGYVIPDTELEKLWAAKMGAKYLSIDYEYINGPGMSY